MDIKTKDLLIRTLSVFNQCDESERREKIDFVKSALKSHYTHLESIGMGYAEHYVQAAKIFLRIYDRPTDRLGKLERTPDKSGVLI